jgi:hypothetical protein
MVLLIGSFQFSEVEPISAQLQKDSVFSSVDMEGEYSSGSLELSEAMDVWYARINSSGTEVVFLTYYSKVYNSPIITFLGEHYTTNDTEVFVGNTLLLMEAYNDTDGNGVPEANFTAGTGEIEYFLLVNSSVTFTSTPVKKVTIGNVSHYVWGIEYGWVDGALLYPRNRIIDGYSTNLAAIVNITRLSFEYDYYIQGNATYLKTGFEIGKIADFKPYASNVSLNGLGFSLLYGTAVFTTGSYSIFVNGKSYDSRTTQAASTSTSQTEVVVENRKIYEFLFEENYTLYRDSAPENYTSRSVASPTSSIPPNTADILSWKLGLFSSDVFPRINANLPNIDLAYANSSFIYRVCYPTWDGWGLEHDPTYVAFLVPAEITPNPTTPPSGQQPNPSSGPSTNPPSSSGTSYGGFGGPIETTATTMVAVAGILALTLALIELRKTRSILKPSTVQPRI